MATKYHRVTRKQPGLLLTYTHTFTQVLVSVVGAILRKMAGGAFGQSCSPAGCREATVTAP
eukprot:1159483-Pelagomonas_calceolata.AAC.4